MNRHWPTHRFAAIAALALLAQAVYAEGSGRPMGIVWEEQGEWSVQGHKLKLLDAVNDGDILTGKPVDRVPNPSITIHPINKMPKIVLQGTKPQPVSMVGQQPLAPSLLSALSVFAAKPDKFIATISRSLTPQLYDSVARLDADKVDLSDCFVGQPAGRYAILFESIMTDSRPFGPFTFDWKPGTDTTCATGSLPGGLYSLEVNGPQGSPLETKPWVLVTTAVAFTDFAQKYQQLNSEMADWDNPALKRTLLRAYLQSLADNPATATSDSVKAN